MSVTSDWSDIEAALGHFARLSSFHPTIAAMKKLVTWLSRDPRFAHVGRSVSHLSLFLSQSHSTRRVAVAWVEATPGSPAAQTGYRVYFVDPPLEFTEERTVGEGDVVEVLRAYLSKL